MLGINGGRIGTSNNSSATSASGVWNHLEQIKAVRDNKWISANVIADGLVLYLDASNTSSYPGSGTIWYDLSGNGNNATLYNGVGYNSSNGGSLVFDGINDYANIPYASVFNMQAYTLSVWVKFFSFNAYNCLIVNPQNGSITQNWSNPYLSWMLRVNNGNTIEVSNGSLSYNSNTYSYGFSTNTIYNIVATYNTTTSAILFYINGTLVSSQSLSGVTINYTGKPVVIATDYGNGFSNCSMYNINVYNRALTSSEVLQNFAVSKSRFGL